MEGEELASVSFSSIPPMLEFSSHDFWIKQLGRS